MDVRLKPFIIKLTEALEYISKVFLDANLNKQEDMSFVMNLVMSAHISSMINMMNDIAQSDTECQEEVKIFIEQMLEQISKTKPINHVFQFSKVEH